MTTLINERPHTPTIDPTDTVDGSLVEHFKGTVFYEQPDDGPRWVTIILRSGLKVEGCPDIDGGSCDPDSLTLTLWARPNSVDRGFTEVAWAEVVGGSTARQQP